MRRSVVLVSGGMDSLVTASIAQKESDVLYFLHLNYGQRTELKELDCFNKLVDYFKPQKMMICKMDFLKEIGGSSLTDMNMDVQPYDADKKSVQVPNTYVPFRNTVMMSIAVSWAETLRADRIYLGAVEEDGSGYPDCREVFFKAFNKVIDLGTKKDTSINVFTPLIHKTKKEIVEIGRKLNSPFEYSWSCYVNNKKACGTCASCRLRLKAFNDAGITDPISYEK